MKRNSSISWAHHMVLDAQKRLKKGKNLSLTYPSIRNPRKALEKALKELKYEEKIPYISDEILKKRMDQIKYLQTGMVGIDGLRYSTQETDEKYFDLFYVETNCHPRTQAFNFYEDGKKITRANNLRKILTKNIFVRIGGYYGFCKITFAELMSQVPDEILNDVVAFSLDPNSNAEILDEEFQSKSIIFYGKSDQEAQGETDLPSVLDLIMPINTEKVEMFKGKIKPVINYHKEGYFYIDPADTSKPFMDVDIWMRINGSNLHRTNAEKLVDVKCEPREKISIYQAFTAGHSADYYGPTYNHVISQIPYELLDEKVIGLVYGKTDYFKTKEGVVHKTTYTILCSQEVVADLEVVPSNYLHYSDFKENSVIAIDYENEQSSLYWIGKIGIGNISGGTKLYGEKLEKLISNSDLFFKFNPGSSDMYYSASEEKPSGGHKGVKGYRLPTELEKKEWLEKIYQKVELNNLFDLLASSAVLKVS
jgi:hypothetical protein